MKIAPQATHRAPLGAWWRGSLALALGALLCAMPAWLMADALRTFLILGDDFAYVAESRTAARLLANLWTPHNAHIVPLFRAWTYLLVRAAGSLENLPVVLCVASYGALVLVMLAAGHFTAQETRSQALGLAAMALIGLSTTIAPAVLWYAAGQALWAALAILLMLLAFQSWRIEGGSGRLVLGFVFALAAPAFWSGGYAAGPVACAYLVADGRPRCRWAGVLALTLAGLTALAGFNLMRRELLSPRAFHDRSLAQAAHPATGLIYTCQAIPESLALANLGIDAPMTAGQGLVLTALILLLWLRTRWPIERIAPLEAAGGTLIVVSDLLVYTFRGYLPFSSLRPLGWYQAIPQVGAALFVLGWWARSRRGPGPRLRFAPLSLRSMGGVMLLAAAFAALQVPRAERQFVLRSGAAEAPSAHDSGSLALALSRARRDSTQLALDQKRFLARLDEAEHIAREQGIGRDAIRAACGRITGPGIPANAETLDAIDLLDLPAEGRESRLDHVQEALAHVLSARRVSAQ